MNRKRWTEVLIRGRSELAETLSADIERAHAVTVLQAPHQAMVMIKLRETARTGVFYLGEVIVSEAKVAIRGSVGLGIVHSSDERSAARLSYHLAVIDAAYRAGLEETMSWLPLLERAEAELASDDARKDEFLLETKVDFQSMDSEDPL